MYMSRSFQNGSFTATRTFGGARIPSTSGSHTEDVKSRTLFRSTYDMDCANIACDLSLMHKKKDNFVGSNGYGYEYLLNCRRGYNLDKDDVNKVPAYNQMDLVSGLYSTLDLNNVTTVCAGVDADTCVETIGMNDNNCPPLYQYYRIDPDGELFGNTPCTINNYLNYVVLEK